MYIGFFKIRHTARVFHWVESVKSLAQCIFPRLRYNIEHTCMCAFNVTQHVHLGGIQRMRILAYKSRVVKELHVEPFSSYRKFVGCNCYRTVYTGYCDTFDYLPSICALAKKESRYRGFA